MSREPEGQPETQPQNAGFDLDFIHRIYRTSLVLVLLGTLFIWERFQAPSALGWLLGAGLSLAALASVEWSTRRYLRPGSQSVGPVAWLTLLKIPIVGVVLVGAFFAAQRGWIRLPWILAGFMLPHVVMVLKLAGRWVNEQQRR